MRGVRKRKRDLTQGPQRRRDERKQREEERGDKRKRVLVSFSEAKKLARPLFSAPLRAPASSASGREALP